MRKKLEGFLGKVGQIRIVFLYFKKLTYDVLHVLVECVSQAGRHQGVGGGDVHKGDSFLDIIKNILL